MAMRRRDLLANLGKAFAVSAVMPVPRLGGHERTLTVDCGDMDLLTFVTYALEHVGMDPPKWHIEAMLRGPDIHFRRSASFKATGWRHR